LNPTQRQHMLNPLLEARRFRDSETAPDPVSQTRGIAAATETAQPRGR
jgi:hypothetical protein